MPTPKIVKKHLRLLDKTVCGRKLSATIALAPGQTFISPLVSSDERCARCEKRMNKWLVEARARMLAADNAPVEEEAAPEVVEEQVAPPEPETVEEPVEEKSEDVLYAEAMDRLKAKFGLAA